MKYFVLILTISLLMACKDEKPSPVTDSTTTTIITATTVTTTIPQVVEIPKYCLAKGMSFQCGNPTWFNLEECKDMGPAYFESRQAIMDQWKLGKVDSCVNIILKSGVKEQLPVVGFGPCIPCTEL